MVNALVDATPISVPALVSAPDRIRAPEKNPERYRLPGTKVTQLFRQTQARQGIRGFPDCDKVIIRLLRRTADLR